MEKIMGMIVFSGNSYHDPDGAAAALREAGYEVARMPEEYRKLMYIKGDEFLEAVKAGSDKDAFRKELGAIVEDFGGNVDEWGKISADHVPFQFLLKQVAN